MEQKKVECCICGSNNWQNVDEYRLKPDGMCICMKCGFCTYPDTIAKSEDLKEFYREEYRDAPTAQNVFTGQRKLHFHNEFLQDLLKSWKTDKFNPKVLEIGSAIGMFLKWIRDNFPQAEVTGTELTKTYRRIAEHSYKIKLDEDFDATKKYDLIASYKVAEHIPYIDREIKKYADCLSEQGFLYISVPTWFGCMSNFGLGGFSLDYYYHKNHINVWTRKLFETLLKKCGLEIVKENQVFYDSTYLCRKNPKMAEEAPQYEEPLEILSRMDKIKKASLLFDSSRFQEAINTWPEFPDAWVNGYEVKRQEWHKKGFDAILEYAKTAKKACPNSHPITMFCADLCMRYSKWDLAQEFLDQALQQKPCDPGALVALGACFRQMAEHTQNPDEKIKLYIEARQVTTFLQQVSAQHSHDAITWIFGDNAKIPMQSELKI